MTMIPTTQLMMVPEPHSTTAASASMHRAPFIPAPPALPRGVAHTPPVVPTIAIPMPTTTTTVPQNADPYDRPATCSPIAPQPSHRRRYGSEDRPFTPDAFMPTCRPFGGGESSRTGSTSSHSSLSPTGMIVEPPQALCLASVKADTPVMVEKKMAQSDKVEHHKTVKLTDSAPMSMSGAAPAAFGPPPVLGRSSLPAVGSRRSSKTIPPPLTSLLATHQPKFSMDALGAQAETSSHFERKRDQQGPQLQRPLQLQRRPSLGPHALPSVLRSADLSGNPSATNTPNASVNNGSVRGGGMIEPAADSTPSVLLLPPMATSTPSPMADLLEEAPIAHPNPNPSSNSSSMVAPQNPTRVDKRGRSKGSRNPSVSVTVTIPSLACDDATFAADASATAHPANATPMTTMSTVPDAVGAPGLWMPPRISIGGGDMKNIDDVEDGSDAVTWSSGDGDDVSDTSFVSVCEPPQQVPLLGQARGGVNGANGANPHMSGGGVEDLLLLPPPPPPRGSSPRVAHLRRASAPVPPIAIPTAPPARPHHSWGDRPLSPVDVELSLSLPLPGAVPRAVTTRGAPSGPAASSLGLRVSGPLKGRAFILRECK